MERKEDLKRELSRRLALKRQKREQTERKKIEKTLEEANFYVQDIHKAYQLETKAVNDLQEILSGDVIGKNICHLWFDEDIRENVVYNGKVLETHPKKKKQHI